MNNIAQNKRKLTSLLAVSLLALAFILFQPDRALAQTPVTTPPPGGTIGKVPKWKTAFELENSAITEDSGKVGIGTTIPSALLHIESGTNGTAHMTIGSFVGTTGGTDNADSGRTIIKFVRGRNIATAPASLANGDTIGKIAFFGYDASATPVLGVGAVIQASVDSAPTVGTIPTALIFQTNSTIERMRITSAGKVGIGTSTPVEHLQIGAGGSNYNFSMATSSNNKGFISTYGDVMTLGINRRVNDGLFTDTGKTHAEIEVFSGNADSKILFLTASANNTLASERMRIDKNGNVGIGTLAPTAKLDVAGDTKVTGNTNVTGSVTASAITSTGNVSAATINSTGIVTAAAITANGNINATGNLALTGTGSISANGNLTLTGTGNITASGTITGGTINAKYQDIAEWVPARQTMTNGTVVVLDPERSNHVMTSWQSYDTTVAGIVSDNPGVILGEAGEGKLKIATTGRVKVKVDATNAPIRVGDLLVTSAQEGVAMRSEPLDLAGTKIHRPGTIIGKALEPLAKGKGEILVLLSMQ